jgi:hypothetical protein
MVPSSSQPRCNQAIASAPQRAVARFESSAPKIGLRLALFTLAPALLGAAGGTPQGIAASARDIGSRVTSLERRTWRLGAVPDAYVSLQKRQRSRAIGISHNCFATSLSYCF